MLERIAAQDLLIKRALTVEDIFAKADEAMLADGMAPGLIAKFTNLPVEEIKVLRRTN
jgi:hypothetical protein